MMCLGMEIIHYCEYIECKMEATWENVVLLSALIAKSYKHHSILSGVRDKACHAVVSQCISNN